MTILGANVWKNSRSLNITRSAPSTSHLMKSSRVRLKRFVIELRVNDGTLVTTPRLLPTIAAALDPMLPSDEKARPLSSIQTAPSHKRGTPSEYLRQFAKFRRVHSTFPASASTATTGPVLPNAPPNKIHAEPEDPPTTTTH